jgi:hypothetical protein
MSLPCEHDPKTRKGVSMTMVKEAGKVAMHHVGLRINFGFATVIFNRI